MNVLPADSSGGHGANSSVLPDGANIFSRKVARSGHIS
jgi:hypothetical protein